MPSASAAASLLADALSPAEWAVFRHVTGALLGTGMLLGFCFVSTYFWCMQCSAPCLWGEVENGAAQPNKSLMHGSRLP